MAIVRQTGVVVLDYCRSLVHPECTVVYRSRIIVVLKDGSNNV